MTEIKIQKVFDFEDQAAPAAISQSAAVAAKKWEDLRNTFSEMLKKPEHNSTEKLEDFTGLLISAAESGAAHYDLSEIINFICINVSPGDLRNNPLHAYTNKMYAKIFTYNRHRDFDPSDDDKNLIKEVISNLKLLNEFFAEIKSHHENGANVLKLIANSVKDGEDFLARYE